jgi:glycosyltransferase involved in cell wall biosynthesis
VIRNNADGILVPPRDSEAISAAVKSLLHSRNQMLSLGLNARRKIEKEFSSVIMANMTLHFYGRML